MISFLLMMGCTTNTIYKPLFDAPIHSAIVRDDQGDWNVSLGFVANQNRGTIVPLDLRHNSIFSDQYSAPFLRSRGIATGQLRTLGAIDAFVPSSDRITLYAIDHYTQSLLEIPYIVGMLPEPQVNTPTYENFESNSSASLDSLDFTTGATTTETWRIEYSQREDAWIATGSRSGRQYNKAYTDTPYVSDLEELSFTITGNGTEGEYFQFSTSTGIIEHDLGGIPMSLLSWEDPYLFVGVWNADLQRSLVSIFNRRQNIEVAQIELPTNTEIGKMLRVGDDLFLSDSNNPRLLRIHIDSANFSASDIEIIPSISLASDLSVIETEDYHHLFVATESRVDIYDLSRKEWKKINPFVDLRGGVELHSPVVGIDSTTTAIPLETTSDWNTPYRDSVVVATLFNGSVIMLEGSTGCVATLQDGPSLSLDSNAYGEIQFNDTGPLSNPEVYTATDGSMLSTFNCGGVLLDEDWTIRYDQTDGSWLVTGSRSGDQDNRLYLDQRYINDTGAFSLLIVSGSLAPTDGDSFTFSTNSNTLNLFKVINNAGSTESLEIPAAPKVFQESADPNAGWVNAHPTNYALIPVTNNGIVISIDLASWSVAHVWN